MNRANLFEEALSLPESDRLELAAELLASTRQESGGLELDTPDFAAEMERRIASFRSGETKGIPMNEALARIQARARR
jgi:putative addiction module component (TIGR02574 family)